MVKEVSDFVVDHVEEEEEKQNGHGSVLAKNDNCSYNKTLKSDRSSNGGAKKKKSLQQVCFFERGGGGGGGCSPMVADYKNECNPYAQVTGYQ